MAGMEIDDALFQIFMVEVTAYVETIQSEDAGLVDKTDAAHGMKGASAMLGFEELSRIAAELEALFREGKTGQTAPLVAKIAQLVDELAAQRQGGESPAQQTPQTTNQGASTAPPAPQPPTSKRPVTDNPTTAAASTPPARGQAEPNDSEWDPETLAMLQSVFREEAAEHIERMDQALADLTKDLASTSAIQSLFRSVHTLKGAAGTVGLDQIGKAAHRFEEMLDGIRSRGKMTGAELAICDRAVEVLRSAAEDPDFMARAVAVMTTVLAGSDADAGNRNDTTDTDDKTSSTHRSKDHLAAALSPKPPPAEHPVPTGAYGPQPERRGKPDRREGGRRDSDRRVVRVPIEDIDGLMDLLAEFVFARTRIQKRAQELSDLVSDLSKTHRGFRHEVISSGKAAGANFRRRLAELEVELADEQTNLDRAVSGLTEEAEWLGKVASRFQEDLVQLRMQSIEFMMLRLQRATDSAARDLGRLVELQIEGTDTRLDRSVAERLVEPMVHLVRNAVAHGIEPPEERQAQGKPKTGRITITAQQEGDFVLLEVSDDGRGIDAGGVRQAAKMRRIASDSELSAMSDEDTLHLIFTPGFTTKNRPDTISGRGVGLDVVHATVVGMGGEVEVHSVPGQGTSFLLRLPLLAAITNALLFKVGGEVMAMSISHVGESCLITPDELSRPHPTVTVAGRNLPVVDLPPLLGVERRSRGRHVPGFVVRWEHTRFVVTCDKIVGPRQIVVRPLSPLLSALPYYYGATISGSGKVQLVMDPSALALVATTDMLGRFGAIPARPDRSGKKVLVCDDSRSIREVLTRVLLEAGYEVEPAVDGWDAWERMLTTDVDLVVTDLEMPRMDGYALIERIRKSPRHASLPVLVLTSRTAEINRHRAQQAGADLFMTKPIKKRLILEQVKQALDKGRFAYKTHQDLGR